MIFLTGNGAGSLDYLLHPSSIGRSLPAQIVRYIRYGVYEVCF